jgi:hypothetical protein
MGRVTTVGGKAACIMPRGGPRKKGALMTGGQKGRGRLEPEASAMEKDNGRANWWSFAAVAYLAIAPVVGYVGSYCTTVRQREIIVGDWVRISAVYPESKLLDLAIVYWPIHQIDRQLRPSDWGNFRPAVLRELD